MEKKFELTQKRILPTTVLSAGKCLQIIHRMLAYINKDLASHCDKTVYFSLLLAKESGFDKRFSIVNLLLIALFHSVGFFRFNANDSTFEYFSKDESEQNYIFARYFLNYMTPVSEDSVSMVYFNQDYNKKLMSVIPQIEYTSIVQIASLVSDFYNKNGKIPKNLTKISSIKLNPSYVKIFSELDSKIDFQSVFASDDYLKEIDDFVSRITLDAKDTLKLLKLLVYVLDFKSTSTVTHTINTACYSYSIGLRFGLDEGEINKLFISALLHDVGKVAIPVNILESPNKLNSADMEIMKTHVDYTKKILEKIVDDDICKIACHHHEKLNGSGYPLGLTEKDFSLSDRILTVSDILSALADSRSYKERFSMDEVFQIIEKMVENGELDSSITQKCFEDFGNIKIDCEIPQMLLISDIAKVTTKFVEYQTSLDKEQLL